MFTVKIIETKGETVTSEQVFEASGVRSLNKEVYVDIESGCCTYTVSPSVDGVRQTMYVMNRYGATVSTFNLTE